ncbi:MAG: substrate-binding domain-containing protein [Planctomycetota bacterium]
MFQRLTLMSSLLLFAWCTLPGCDTSGQSSPAPGAGADPAGDSTPDSPAASTPSATSRKIGYSALTLTNPFFRIIADTMQQEARKKGYEFTVVSGDQDVNRQTAQIEDFIVQGVAAIVLNPCDSKAIGTAIRKANEAGIPVFTNDIKYAGNDAKVECHVATDNLQGGRLAGEAIVKLLRETGGKVAIVDYPDVESCQLRVTGFREVIDQHNATPGQPQIEIATVLNGQGAREAGHAAARDAVQAHPDLSALFAINDPSALGARVALEESGKAEQVRIVGFDGAIEGRQAILDGKIVCDPVQFPDRMAETTIEMISRWFAGEDVPPEILIPSELYYREDAVRDAALQQPATVK